MQVQTGSTILNNSRIHLRSHSDFAKVNLEDLFIPAMTNFGFYDRTQLDCLKWEYELQKFSLDLYIFKLILLKTAQEMLSNPQTLSRNEVDGLK